jgi:hypothetical protein
VLFVLGEDPCGKGGLVTKFSHLGRCEAFPLEHQQISGSFSWLLQPCDGTDNLNEPTKIKMKTRLKKIEKNR